MSHQATYDKCGDESESGLLWNSSIGIADSQLQNQVTEASMEKDEVRELHALADIDKALEEASLNASLARVNLPKTRPQLGAIVPTVNSFIKSVLAIGCQESHNFKKKRIIPGNFLILQCFVFQQCIQR